MSNLLELCQTGLYPTDKFYPTQGWHSYIENFYSEQFVHKQQSAKNILEIGVWQGASLRLWKDYFSHANIIGIDIKLPDLPDELFTDDRLSLIRGNAYSDFMVDNFKDEHFDIIIDDGPHTYESQCLFFKKYLRKVKPDGYLICEDIKGIDYLLDLIRSIPLHYRNNLQIIDLREKDNRFDSLILFLKK